jgi:hypothetical protein
VIENKQTIISKWLLSKSKHSQTRLLNELGKAINLSQDIPIDGVIEQLAAGLMAACAKDLGLSPLELTGLLRSPRKDALAGLVTVLHNGEQ